MANGNTIIRQYARSAFPIVAVETCEDARALAVIKDELEGWEVLTLSATGELIDARANSIIESGVSVPKALAKLNTRKTTALVVYDVHHLIDNCGIYRSLKIAATACKALGNIIIMIAPVWKLSDDFRRECALVKLPLPTRGQLNDALEVVRVSASLNIDADKRELLLDAATGLTQSEAENCYALAASRAGIDHQKVNAEKVRLIRSSGLATILPALPSESLGGLGGYKKYLHEQIVPWVRDPQLRVKGVLFTGVAGCGKTLSARVTGSVLGYNIIRGDIGSLKGSLVGQSESNMRSFTDLCDASAPAVVLLDEIDKGVAGVASSGQTDAGTTSGMFSHILQWFENQTGCLVIATSNRYEVIPSELLRRFSERFFVDVPTKSERREIAQVHLARLRCDVEAAGTIAELTADWTGSEVEELIISAARLTNRKLEPKAIMAIAAESKPMCKTRGEEIDKLREWGKINLRRANSEYDAMPSGRKMDFIN